MRKKTDSIHHGYKTFLEALEMVQSQGMKAKKYLKDNRLTIQEKKLLDLYLRIRLNDFSSIDELEKDASFDSLPFMKGLRFYLMGVVLVYKSDSRKAEEYLKSALPYFTECQNEKFIRRLIFKTQVNLFYVYVNQKRIPEMKELFGAFTSIPRESEEDEMAFMTMSFCHHLMTDDYVKAEELVEELTLLMPRMTEIQVMNFLIDKFDFFIKMDLYGKAEGVLREMKNYRTYRLSANFQYADRLLKFLTKDQRIYAYDREFIGHEDLYLMINVIKSLEEADEFQASLFWNRLAQNSPQTYRPGFDYQGDKCLFSVCLKKCLHRKPSSPSHTLTSSYTGQEQKLIDFIQRAQGFQSKKEFLYEHVYGREMTGKDDLVALSSIVYRINKKGELLIKSKKGSYYLVMDNKKSA